jgi:hypothetical protein
MTTAASGDMGYDTRYASGEMTDAGAGWIVYAAIMLGLAGVWNIFEGIAAIASSKVYVAGATFVFSDLKTWGWIILVLGVLLVCAAMALFGGSQLARWFGIFVAALNAVGQLGFVQAYPFWTLAMFALDVLIIYGLAVYGGKETFAE